MVDSLYRSKYFLTSQKRKFEDEHRESFVTSEDHDDHRESFVTSEDEINTNASEVHRITILNRPEDFVDPSTEISAVDNNIAGHQPSEVDPPKTNRVETLELHFNDAQICRPLLPWMNGDGTINEPVYKGLIRRLLGIVMQNPGILEVCYFCFMQDSYLLYVYKLLVVITCYAAPLLYCARALMQNDFTMQNQF